MTLHLASCEQELSQKGPCTRRISEAFEMCVLGKVKHGLCTYPTGNGIGYKYEGFTGMVENNSSPSLYDAPFEFTLSPVTVGNSGNSQNNCLLHINHTSLEIVAEAIPIWPSSRML